MAKYSNVSQILIVQELLKEYQAYEPSFGNSREQLDASVQRFSNRFNGLISPITRDMTACQVLTYLTKRCKY
jgi:exoribonuclease R